VVVAGRFSRERGIRATPIFLFAFYEKEQIISQSKLARIKILHALNVLRILCILKAGDLACNSAEKSYAFAKRRIEIDI
jgi:hypothetical protein